jgi:hypothetical protein
MKSLLLVPILCLAALTARAGGPAVTIVTGPEAPELERLAATELSGLLRSLFDATVTVSTAAPADATVPRILLGSPGSNPTVKAVYPADLGEQGHIVRSTPSGLVIAGGSPVATLWAVYEYGYANGMRYLTSGDFAPVEKPTFTTEGFDLVMKPLYSQRAWRVIAGGPASQEAWGVADFEKLLPQLAKLKFNAVILPGSVKATGFDPVSVTGDIAGRSVFGGAKEFRNPDLTGETGADARWIAGIQTAAKRSGMITEPADPALLNLSLGQPNGGLLPETFPFAFPGASAGFHIDTPLREESKLTGGKPGIGIPGFAVSASLVGDINPQLHYLSRAAWDAAVTPESALRDLATPICGEGVAEPLALGFAAIAEISALIEKEDPGFAVPAPEMFMEHYRSPAPAPEWWAKAKELYAKGMNEMYRANTRARDGARPWILYHAKRYTFALHYMGAVEAAHKAGLARADQDDDLRIENLELAIESMHNALGIYSEVAADQSDRGVIAVLNAFGYRPLLEALEEE